MLDETSNFDPNDIWSSKSLAWLSYVSILFLVPMLVRQNSPFTKFHVNQGIVLFIVSIIANVVAFVLEWVPFFGDLLSTLIRLAVVALAIVGIIYALQGTAKRLPIIGNIDIYR